MPAPMKIDPEELARMWKRGDKLAEIARRFNCAESSVSNCARLCGLPKRKPGRWPEAAQ